MSARALADLTRALVFRSYQLNAIARVNGVNQGCQVDQFAPAPPDVRQFTEPLAKEQGLDVGGVWWGGRVLQMAGTVYGLSRADAFDRIGQLEDLFDPTAIYAADPANFGFADLTWYVASAGGAVLRTLEVRPNGLVVASKRSMFGGPDGAPLAIPWSVSFLARDPVIS